MADSLRSAFSTGQATVCGVAIGIKWSQPGQRYDLVEAAPVIIRTFQSPSDLDSIRSFSRLGFPRGVRGETRRLDIALL